MNENISHKKANSKHGLQNLQDYSIHFEEIPPTIFRNKWLKNTSKKYRKFKFARKTF